MKKKISWNKIKPETQSVWGGEIKTFPHGATQTPTVNSVAYGYDNLDEWMQVAKGEKDLIPIFITKLTFANAASHLGSIDTIVGPPKTTSHVENTMEERSALGIPENMVRCSVGIENIDDIKIDFLQALESL